MTLDLLLVSFLVFGFYFCLTLAVAQVSEKFSRRHFVSAVLYVCIALLLLSNINVNAELEFYVKTVMAIEAPLTMAIGPLMFIIFAETLHPKRYRYWPHFILPVLSIIPIALMNADPDFKHVHPFTIELGYADPIYNIYVLVTATTLFYFVRILQLLGKPAFSIDVVKSEESIRQLFVVVFFSLLVVFFTFMSIVTSSFLFLRLTMVCIVLGVVVAFWQGMHHADYFESLSDAIVASQIQRSHLANVDVDRLAKNLKTLMEEDELYLDPDISLTQLADNLAVSRHQLSEYLNAKLNQSFSNYINTFRVEAAKKTIRERQHISLLAIGYQSGFNSKQSFIRRFKSITNMTPMQYRKKYGAES